MYWTDEQMAKYRGISLEQLKEEEREYEEKLREIYRQDEREVRTKENIVKKAKGMGIIYPVMEYRELGQKACAYANALYVENPKSLSADELSWYKVHRIQEFGKLIRNIKSISRALKSQYGETHVEDNWRPIFEMTEQQILDGDYLPIVGDIIKNSG
jgi:hypothetical protein